MGEEILIKLNNGTFKVLCNEELHDFSEYQKASSLKPALKPAAPQNTFLLQEKAREVIQEGGISLHLELEERALQIILSSLKGVRDSIQTDESLRKPVTQGGLGLKQEEIAALQRLIEKNLEVAPLPYSQFTLPRSSASPLAPAPKPSEPPPSPPAFAPVLLETATKTIPARIPGPASPYNLPIVEEKTSEAKTTPLPKLDTSTPVVFKTVPRTPGKVPVIDVRAPVKLVSPALELQMALAYFRRLCKDPKMAAQAIKNKLNLLAEDSFAAKLNGIKAWRKGEVYQLYSLIIKESVAQGRSFKEIILDEQRLGRETLTSEEFLVVVELNKEMRF